ncbi:TAXI family TRAP transporter solute-binding subunit [Sporosarcina thermotolerans]|uniref:TAXI family TRAP transporter solute-binding subunit n=1 Tax=Sporosarcina thermotolerans TaxID=633404 RepID=A0AAW9A7P0_9BACL|nr:TAXI family TRAP transporter solute-binding subunit [Sporosarcina thermotolerans]MDW0117039.1 TAXI family TRAP transporter solute-binding subunit [Sporosarcina thermotolerans]WHT47861.1 TAXI family TRAP transporter solute-binding subunit [Sporosarcina thermotolerans]
MNKRVGRILALMSVLTLLLLSACGKKDVEYLSILTGGTQGTYYALGGALAENIGQDTGIKTTAEVSQASAANMTALKDGKAELAFVQTDIAYYASKGEMMFDGEIIDTVSAIGFLYPETVQLVTLEKSGIKSFADLKGKKVSVGAPGSGTYANAEQLLEIHGLTMDDIQAQDLDFGESTESLQAGQIDAAFITAGTPTAAVEGLNATAQVFIVPVEDAKADELIAKYGYYAKEVIPAGTYGIANDTPTVSVGAMLVIQNDIPEDVAYKITKSIYDNASKLTHPKAALIKAETGLDGIGIPVHPGAKKYFDEQK